MDPASGGAIIKRGARIDGCRLESSLKPGGVCRARQAGGRALLLADLGEGTEPAELPEHPGLLRHLRALRHQGRTILLLDCVGESLAERLWSPMEPALALDLWQQILAAMAAAHGAGVVHGALTPARIFLDDTEPDILRARIAGFRNAQADPHDDVRALGLLFGELFASVELSLPPRSERLVQDLQRGDPQRRHADALALREAWRIAVVQVSLPAQREHPPAPTPAPASSETSSPRRRAGGWLRRMLAPRRRACARGLVVDAQARPRVVLVDVELYPHSAAPRESLTEMSPECVEACQLGAVLGLGHAGAHWGVRWSVRARDVRLRGRSLALAVAVATRAALQGRRIPTHWGFSGDLGADGALHPVEMLRQKLQQAQREGLQQVALPGISPSAADLGAPQGADASSLALARPFEHLEPLLQRLLPPLRRPWILALALFSLPLLTVLLFHLDARVPALIRDLDHVMAGQADDVVPVILDGERYLDRTHQARVVRELLAADVASIVYDLLLVEEKSSEGDELLLSAFEDAIRQGVTVALPAALRSSEGPDVAQLAAPLRALDGLRIGMVQADQTSEGLCFWYVAEDDQGRKYHHVALLAAQSWLGGDAPIQVIDQRTLGLGHLRLPLADGCLQAGPLPRFRSLRAEEDLNPVAGKIAVVGVVDEDLDRHPEPGVEHVAGLVHAILQGRLERPLSPLENGLLASATALLFILSGWRLPRWLLFPAPDLSKPRIMAHLALLGLLPAAAILLITAAVSLLTHVPADPLWPCLAYAISLPLLYLSKG